ncbi:cation diffusion facilitator family transporter [Beduini massiliensis]|mgnify:CR=1 FL=1|uniref:cation diffusion facilitator family transporter n=1 Tax=Beduini massiliensis TaxID=1585974 RepID=UPI000AD71EDA|nr:cation diffusion facilitator family transporter [Beduini massiliensis]
MQFLIKKCIKDYEQVDKREVRERYGTFVSIISIICNIVLATSKLIVGIFSKSISIQADALNNYSDVGSNLATLFGFKLASKHPDTDHPYGHGRIEYISGLIISFLILLVALQSLKESVMKIIQPEVIHFSYLGIAVLIFSMLVKFLMAKMNKNIGERIHSTSLKAASQDSYNDMITTFAAMIGMLVSHFASWNIDGWIGLFVSFIVLKAGYDVFKDTVGPLLGQAPDKELVEGIANLVMSYQGILGIHDFMLHDYGPGRSFVTLHAEIDCHDDLLEIHDVIDLVEREILSRFNVHATIHMDPIDSTNEMINELKGKVIEIIKKINPAYTIHDFRLVSGPTHTNILFDVVLPPEDETNVIELKQKIDQEVKQLDKNFFTVVEVDRAYY